MAEKMKKLVSYILVFVMIIASVSVSAAEVESDDYAEVVLSAGEMHMRNAKLINFNLPSKTELGKSGAVTNGDGFLFIKVDIDDAFMYQLPNNTPVDITVEYFDDSDGEICIHYDSNEPIPHWNNMENNTYASQSEIIELTNTKKWKTYTFHLEDLYAGNRFDNSYDFRVGTWNPTTGFSPKDVLLGSIKVEYSKYLTPLKVDGISMGHVGNLMSAEEEKYFDIPIYNKTEEELVADWDFKVYDEYERLIGEYKHNSEIAPGEKRTERINIENPEKYGIYTVDGVVDVYYKNNPELKYTNEVDTKFSISYIYGPENTNHDFGANHQMVSHSYAKSKEVAESMSRMGMGILREESNSAGFVKIGPGEYKAKESSIQMWSDLVEQGVELHTIIFNDVGCDRVWNQPPSTDEEIAEYGKWAGCVAKELKGICNVFEVWNEYNYSGFNIIPDRATPENYVKMCKVVYEEIKAVNPDAVILGLSTAPPSGTITDYEWSKAVFEAGGYQYMDAIAIHPYDWAGTNAYDYDLDEITWMKELNEFKELMSEYGELKPIYFTEFGFSSAEGETYATHKEQYQCHVLGRALSKSYELCDKYVAYCLADREDRRFVEENWGFVNSFRNPEPVQFSAKPSFVAMAAFNKFVSSNTKAVNTIADGRIYSFHYYNNDLQKDVLLLESAQGFEGTRSFNLGCNSLELFDSYGNKMADLVSDNGEYSFYIDRDPVYAVGTFNNFAVIEKEPVIDVEFIKSAASGDVVTYNIIKNTDKPLYIQAEGIEVIENNGFKGNKAELKVKMPSPTSNMDLIVIEDYIPFTITVKDGEGKTYYCDEMKPLILDPVEVNVKVEGASELNSNRRCIMVNIKNLSNSTPITGEVDIVQPASVKELNEKRSFENVVAGDSITFAYNLPETVNKTAMEIVAEIKLDNGFNKKYSQQAQSFRVYYATEKPVIDGKAGSLEWYGADWIAANEEKDLGLVPDWTGVDDCSFNGTMKWDEENLYFLGIARDDIHFTDHDPTPERMWQADSFQIGIADGIVTGAANKGDYTEFTIGDYPGFGDTLFRHLSMYGTHEKGVVYNCEIAIERYDKYTLYECKIPWSEIFGEGYVVDTSKEFRFAAMLNDNDGDSRYYISYMGGIGTSKDAREFGVMKLIK